MTTAKLAKMDSLRSEASAEAEGEWVDLIEIPDAKVLVRALDYPPYTAARFNVLKRFARAYGQEPTPQNLLTPAIGKLYAEHILLGWEGFDVPYSKDAALERLSDWEWRKLVAAVENAAASLSAVKVAFVEDSAKKSEPSSATN